MKNSIKTLLLASLLITFGCKQGEETASEPTSESTEVPTGGQENVVDATSNPNIVQTAIGSKDHTTLVAAVKAAGLVTSLSNAGPFTVFAPTNAAFTAFLGETTYSSLSAIPANVLEKTLKYHVVTGANVLSTAITENQVITTFSGQTATVKFTPTRLLDVSGRNCNIIATDVQCSNGVIHVLEKVLLPTFAN